MGKIKKKTYLFKQACIFIFVITALQKTLVFIQLKNVNALQNINDWFQNMSENDKANSWALFLVIRIDGL